MSIVSYTCAVGGGSEAFIFVAACVLASILLSAVNLYDIPSSILALIPLENVPFQSKTLINSNLRNPDADTKSLNVTAYGTCGTH